MAAGQQQEPDLIGEPDELARVREGEELNWEALESYLRTVLDVDGPFEVLQFPNGSANLTYLVLFGDDRFVVRRPPFGEVAPGAHDMRREHAALSKLWCAYPRAPRSFHLCTDHDVVGSDFLVMEYREGVVVWRAVPSTMVDKPDAGRRIGDAVVDALADLHAVDPAAVSLEDLGRPEGFLQRQLRGWTRRWERVAPMADHPVARLGAMLTEDVPTSPATAVLHNDFKVDNCQFRRDDPDEVISVFDWDMATLGDPLVDLGTLLNYWPDELRPDEPAALPGTENLGLSTQAEALERYAERTGTNVARMDWYIAFATWRVTIILQQLYDRYLRGESSDPRMATRGDRVVDLAERGIDRLTNH